jgi:hypothetical protein
MASKYGVYVHGVDLSVNMVTTALERAFAAKDGHKVLPSPQIVHFLCMPLYPAWYLM